jgi:hypothetical protein
MFMLKFESESIKPKEWVDELSYRTVSYQETAWEGGGTVEVIMLETPEYEISQMFYQAMGSDIRVAKYPVNDGKVGGPVWELDALVKGYVINEGTSDVDPSGIQYPVTVTVKFEWTTD